MKLKSQQIKSNQMLLFAKRGKLKSPRRTLTKQGTNKLNPHMTAGHGIEPVLHWWERSALTTPPTLLVSKDSGSRLRQRHFLRVPLQTPIFWVCSFLRYAECCYESRANWWQPCLRSSFLKILQSRRQQMKSSTLGDWTPASFHRLVWNPRIDA